MTYKIYIIPEHEAKNNIITICQKKKTTEKIIVIIVKRKWTITKISSMGGKIK